MPRAKKLYSSTSKMEEQFKALLLNMAYPRPQSLIGYVLTAKNANKMMKRNPSLNLWKKSVSFDLKKQSLKRKMTSKKSSGILCEGNRLEAYRFIDEYKEIYGLRWLLSKFDIKPNAYYNYLKNSKAEYYKHKQEICDTIRDIYHECSGNIGHRFMKVFLERKGIHLSKTTIHKYMNQEMHLYSICRRKKPNYKKGRPHKLFPNLLEQNFVVTEPNRV